MSSTKRLRSVIHSIAHHSVSGLCHVHPHLGQACKAIGVKNSEIDLINGIVKLPDGQVDRPLVQGALALSEKFFEVLKSEGLDKAELDSARIDFQFNRGRIPNACYIRVVTRSGKVLEDMVDSSGRRAEVLHGSI